MSLFCRVVIGWFGARPPPGGQIMPSKALDADHLYRLQAACDELFDIKVRLIDLSRMTAFFASSPAL